MFTIPDSLPRVLFRLMDQAIAGSVSPSAVWYTGYIFVRSGLIVSSYGSLRHFGLDGRIWSRSAADNSPELPRAMYLNFAPGVVKPSGITGRAIGDPVRCLVILVLLRP